MASSKEIIQKLEADGWYLKEIKGSHHQFKHPIKKGRVPVPHPRKDISKGTEMAILKQAGRR